MSVVVSICGEIVNLWNTDGGCDVWMDIEPFTLLIYLPLLVRRNISSRFKFRV